MYTPIDTYTHLYGAVSAHGGAGWLPAIHNALFAMRGDCATLLPINAGKADMTELMKCVGAEAEADWNFDMPLSARAFELTDENDELAARMGMVDTVSVSRLGARVGHLRLRRAHCARKCAQQAVQADRRRYSAQARWRRVRRARCLTSTRT